MKNLIAYATKYGCAQKCAMELSKELKDDVELIDLKGKNKIDLSRYDKIIVGGSVYMGKIQKEVSNFCTENLNELLKKEIGLFICGMQSKDMIEKEINDNFPEELLKKAKSVKHLGGEFSFKKMNFMEKTIVKKVSKITSDKTDINYNNIKDLVTELNS